MTRMSVGSSRYPTGHVCVCLYRQQVTLVSVGSSIYGIQLGVCVCLYRQPATRTSVGSSIYPTGHVSPTDDYKPLYLSDSPFQRFSIIRESREFQNWCIVSIHPGKSIIKQHHHRCRRHLMAVFPGSAGSTFLPIAFLQLAWSEHPLG